MPRKKNDDDALTISVDNAGEQPAEKPKPRRRTKAKEAVKEEVKEEVKKEVEEEVKEEKKNVRKRTKKATEAKAEEKTPEPEEKTTKKRSTKKKTTEDGEQATETAAKKPRAKRASSVKAKSKKQKEAEQLLLMETDEEQQAPEVPETHEVPEVQEAVEAAENQETSSEITEAAEVQEAGDAASSTEEPGIADITSAYQIHMKYSFKDLEALNIRKLRVIGKEFAVPSVTVLNKETLINEILRLQAAELGFAYRGGTLDILDESGNGFLRNATLLPTNEDIFVSQSQIKRFGLRNGDLVWGEVKPPKDAEHYDSLLRVENVNSRDPEAALKRPRFENLTPIFPNEKLNLETDRNQIATRIVDIFAPIGKGQRALIVSPPKAGKTTLLKNIAHAIVANNPKIILMVLLIDERPEEVTDMARSVNGEIIASTFDKISENHMRVARIALEKAKRLVEYGNDVVILLDSITRLARASNLDVTPSGRTLSGGMDPAALHMPKNFFGAARNIERGGSLTIIGTALVETGSRLDDVIYEEFKGTGNMEVHLSRKVSEQRIFPALDITKSGTRKEELLVPKENLERIWSLRRKIANMDEADVLNLILDKLKSTPSNEAFLNTIKV